LAVPVAMLFIFGWAINTDVKHIPTAVFEQSGSLEARLFLEAMENSQYFDLRHHVGTQTELTRLIDSGAAKVGVVIPPDHAGASPGGTRRSRSSWTPRIRRSRPPRSTPPARSGPSARSRY
ncbi:MAG: ABC transporter permease, partial [Candidatus Rokuibacteriota bacterium]